MRSARGYLIIFVSICLVSFLSNTTVFGENLKDIQGELDSRDWKVRFSAVEKLGKIKDNKSLNLLIQVAGTRGEYWPVKIKAIQFLGEMADPSALEILLEIFNDPFLNSECPSIKSFAAIALGGYKHNELAFRSLITGIDDPELLTKEASIESLGRIGKPEAVNLLLPLLNDKSFTVRHVTIKALANTGDKRAIPYLNNLAENDKDLVIREIARLALKTF